MKSLQNVTNMMEIKGWPCFTLSVMDGENENVIHKHYPIKEKSEAKNVPQAISELKKYVDAYDENGMLEFKIELKEIPTSTKADSLIMTFKNSLIKETPMEGINNSRDSYKEHEPYFTRLLDVQSKISTLEMERALFERDKENFNKEMDRKTAELEQLKTKYDSQVESSKEAFGAVINKAVLALAPSVGNGVHSGISGILDNEMELTPVQKALQKLSDDTIHFFDSLTKVRRVGGIYYQIAEDEDKLSFIESKLSEYNGF